MTQPTIAQLHNLTDRAAHGLTADEQQRLRDGIDQLHAELKHARADIAACRAQQWPQRLGEAEKALARVRALRNDWAATPRWVDHVPRRAAAMLTAALDGTPEPTMADLKAAEYEPAPGPATAQATEPGVDRQTAIVLAALHRSAEADVSRVITLYEQWVKAGPPPLGTLINRWWDKRLVELHAALNPKEN